MTAGISRSIRLVATPENGSWSELRAPSQELRTARRSETSSARIVPSWIAADPPPASDLVLEQQDAVVGVLVVAAVTDEVEDVVVAAPKLSLEGTQACLLEPVDGDGAAFDQWAERGFELRPLLLGVDRLGVVRGADHRQDPDRQRDLERPARLREVEVAHDRRPRRDRQEARVVVHVFPRDLEELGRARQRERDAQSLTGGPRLRERRAVQLANVSLEQGTEELRPERLGQVHLGRIDASTAAPGAHRP